MRPSGGRGRESSMKKTGSDAPMPSRPNPMAADSEHGTSGGQETKIIHHPDGQHEVHHADGEVTKHPSAGHMAASIHAKHGSGQVGNMENDGMGGPITTHSVGSDGEVSGPQEHATPEEGAGHLAQLMSGMDNEGSEPDGGDEYGAGFAG